MRFAHLRSLRLPATRPSFIPGKDDERLHSLPHRPRTHGKLRVDLAHRGDPENKVGPVADPAHETRPQVAERERGQLAPWVLPGIAIREADPRRTCIVGLAAFNGLEPRKRAQDAHQFLKLCIHRSIDLNPFLRVGHFKLDQNSPLPALPSPVRCACTYRRASRPSSPSVSLTCASWPVVGDRSDRRTTPGAASLSPSSFQVGYRTEACCDDGPSQTDEADAGARAP